MKRLIIMCGLVAAMASVAWAKSGYLSTFNTKYGTSRTRLDSGTLCHVSGSNSRNVYGRAFGTALSANNATVQSALTAIENQMVSEEIGLNAHLEASAIEVVETDLGEYVAQLRGERPSHIIAPIIHLNRDASNAISAASIGTLRRSAGSTRPSTSWPRRAKSCARSSSPPMWASPAPIS